MFGRLPPFKPFVLPRFTQPTITIFSSKPILVCSLKTRFIYRSVSISRTNFV